MISERYQEDTDNQNCENSSDIGTISLTRSRETEGEREKGYGENRRCRFFALEPGRRKRRPDKPAGLLPSSQILAIYSELLPMARQPRDWTAGRQALPSSLA